MKGWGHERASRITGSIELRQVGDLLKYSVPLGALAVLLHCFGAKSGIHVLGALSAGVLYLAALFLPRPMNLLTVLLFALSFLCSSIDVEQTLRLIVFATLLSSCYPNRVRLPPVTILFLAWITFLLAQSTIRVDRGNEYALIYTKEIWQFFLEIVAVLVIALVRFSRRLSSLLGTKAVSLDVRTFLVHVVTIAVLSAVMLVTQALFSALELRSDHVLDVLTAKPLALTSVLASIFLVPLVMGQLLSRLGTEILDHLRLTISPESRLLLNNRQPAPLSEVRDVHEEIRSRFSDLNHDLRTAQTTIRDLQRQAQETEDQIKDREISALNLERLMDHAPWGTIACSGNGLIISVNERFCSLLNIKNKRELPGQHISVIDAKHTWRKEILATLAWAFRDWRQLVEKGTVHHYTSAINNTFLELLLRIVPATERAGSDVEPGALLVSDIAVSLYIREVPDLRDFQLRLLTPSYFEVAGTQITDIGRDMRNQLSTIVGHLSVATEIANRDPSTDEKLIASLREVEKIARLASRDLQEFEEKLGVGQKKQSTRIDLHFRLQHSLDYLYSLLAQDERLIVNNDEVDDAETETESLFITAPEEDFSRFVAYFLFFIRNLMPRAPAIEASLAYESISPEAAAMLAGSHAGHYARLVIHHAGQSLTANMMTGKYHRLEAGALENSLEVALSLLHAQTAQLGGFISAQSTTAKGTTITIYIPVERDALAEASAPHKSRKHFKRKTFNEQDELARRALLVGTESETLAMLGSMFTHLGYDSDVRDPRTLSLVEPADALTFGGSGFGFPTIDEGSPRPTSRSEVDSLSAYNLLVLNVEQGPTVTLPLLHSLEQANGNAATLLVIDSSLELERMFQDWALLKKPFDVSSLEAAIKDAIARA